jgi:RimJ/RimL family protein N-acetyltransferase
MLEGDTVNLRIMEKADLPLVVEWANDPDFGGEFEPVEQVTLGEIERWLEQLPSGEKWFMIEKKDGSKIGHIMHKSVNQHYTIGYRVLPTERNQGYCTEAVQILVDYLFLSANVVRVQAETNPANLASQRVLEKAGFTKEGVIRKSTFIRGKWQDGVLYSILRDEWKQPHILKK